MGNKERYSQVIKIITHYLFRYPSITVAIECAVEEITDENLLDIKEDLSQCLKQIYEGKNEIEVLLTYAEEHESKEFKEFIEKIADGTTKHKDIGFYVKGIDPVEYFKERNNQQKKKKPFKKH